MSWTDERVELLKKLWMEGLSASQIAGELGQGVTRNAVIGKVHRLKLSARAKPATSAPRNRPAASRPTPRRSVSGGGGGSGSVSAGAMKRRTVTAAPMRGATALKMDAQEDVELQVYQAEEPYVAPEDRIGLLGLTESTCKWPIGDPLNSDFYFCGQHSSEGKPYCDFHSRRAYHQMDRKKK